VERRVALITTSFHSAMFSLPDSDLILPMPANILNSVQQPEVATALVRDPGAAGKGQCDAGLAPAVRQRPGASLLLRRLKGGRLIRDAWIASDAT
jgi:hypothetical protein